MGNVATCRIPVIGDCWQHVYDSSSVSEVAHIDMINGTTEDDERPAKERVSTEELLKPRCDLILA